jgi:putative RNA 2'-phosphotransferase
MRDDLAETSKFLSFVLRHRPDSIGLTLAQGGWVSIEALLKAALDHGKVISRETLDEVVYTNDKQRFSFSPDGLNIRANQGHSVDVDLGLPIQEPPAIPYHGTATRFLPAIRAEGLNRRTRQHVHLSPTIDAAQRVGMRHGKPVVLKINAARMNMDGLLFHLSANGVWLTEHVPPIYLEEI